MIYRWRRIPFHGGNNPLYRRICRVLARGKKNSALVEFENGERHIVSRNALKKVSSMDGVQ